MHLLCKFKKIAPGRDFNRLPPTHVEKWVRSLVERETSTYDPSIIEKCLAGLRLHMNIADPGARMLDYCSLFFERLEPVGYGICKENNPKITVSLLTSKLYLKKFKETIQQDLEHHEDLKKDLVMYVELLWDKAKVFEEYKQQDQQRDKSNKKNDRQEGHRTKGTVMESMITVTGVLDSLQNIVLGDDLCP